jgi:xylulokinase
MEGLQFNRHDKRHRARAAKEGIVFALQIGMELLQEMGMKFKTIRAGYANIFLSPVFASAFANTSGCAVELYNTDGAQGAARAAGVGAGIYKSFKESFAGMHIVKSYEPDNQSRELYTDAYSKWKASLNKRIDRL